MTKIEKAFREHALPKWMIPDLCELCNGGGSGYVADRGLLLEMLKYFDAINIGGSMGFGMRHVSLKKDVYDFLVSEGFKCA